MYRLLSVLLLSVLAVAVSAAPALAAGGDKAKKQASEGYFRVDKMDSNAKTFTLANGNTYKYTDKTVNKGLIYVGSIIKVTVKPKSDQVVEVEATAPPPGKGKKK